MKNEITLRKHVSEAVLVVLMFFTLLLDVQVALFTAIVMALIYVGAIFLNIDLNDIWPSMPVKTPLGMNPKDAQRLGLYPSEVGYTKTTADRLIAEAAEDATIGGIVVGSLCTLVAVGVIYGAYRFNKRNKK